MLPSQRFELEFSTRSCPHGTPSVRRRSVWYCDSNSSGGMGCGGGGKNLAAERRDAPALLTLCRSLSLVVQNLLYMQTLTNPVVYVSQSLLPVAGNLMQRPRWRYFRVDGSPLPIAPCRPSSSSPHRRRPLRDRQRPLTLLPHCPQQKPSSPVD